MIRRFFGKTDLKILLNVDIDFAIYWILFQVFGLEDAGQIF